MQAGWRCDGIECQNLQECATIRRDGMGGDGLDSQSEMMANPQIPIPSHPIPIYTPILAQSETLHDPPTFHMRSWSGGTLAVLATNLAVFRSPKR